MKKSLELILNIKESVNVFQTNEFVFAIPFTVVGTHRGSDCLKNLPLNEDHQIQICFRNWKLEICYFSAPSTRKNSFSA